ncbi:penicillin acylase family protein [Parvicella tangerina]|uniref:Penicillin acylase family protein n=1 Tax=Parvicella tangerina TaxID=2829795 RepID=A0A916JNF0_9FLAO|nr:penicillin acylase family protein [Parvicella tangerina]CAG5080772.1 hypothetical protein CRYO30217_01440 [Parvicella tangerina]
MKISYEKEISFVRQEMGTFEIQTQTEKDFYYAMGFAHATDRPTQLLLMRILGKGEACEHLMDNEEMLELDIFFRRMNWKSELSKEIDKFSEEELKLAQAYCDGINQIILKKRPFHFKLIGYHPTPWTIEDSLLISRMTGYISLAQSQGEVERFFLQLVKNGVSVEKLHELFPAILNGCDFETLRKVNFSEKIVPDSVKWMNMISAAIASNNWVVDGSKTKSGKPILANDPHLETNRLPNVWYELSIHLRNRYFKGCTMPGLPACLIGRTNDLSWGATYTFMDAIDSWVEDVKDGQYLLDEQRLDFSKRQEVIKRKKHDDYLLEVYENEHGVLDGTPNDDGFYLTTQWSSRAAGHQSVRAIRNMFYAKTVEEGMKHIGQLEVSFNWVLADSLGNIGYQMSGMMPLRKDSWSGFYPIAGWQSKNNWKGFVRPEDLPRVYNPTQGYFITCNQDLNEFGEANPINIAMGDYRFRRVKQLLDENQQYDVPLFQKMQNDLYAIQAKEMVDYFLPHMTGAQKELLENWDFNYHPDQKAPTLFEELYTRLIMELLSASLGEDVAHHIITDTGILVDFYLNFDQIIHNPNAKWFETISRDEMIKRSVDKVKSKRIVRWGDINQITMTNMFFGGKLPGFLGFDKGPIELKGGRSSIHQGQVYTSAGRITSFTPSYRFITDMDESFIYSTLAGGASDKRWSKFYANEVDNWKNGIYKKY